MTVALESRLAALKDAVIEFGEAWASGDLATLDELLSATYTHHDAYGARLDRQAWLAYAAKRTGRETKLEFEGVVYRVFEDAAVVTGTNLVKGGGARFAEDARDLAIVFTQVWVWKDGRWLREAFQAAPVIEDIFG